MRIYLVVGVIATFVAGCNNNTAPINIPETAFVAGSCEVGVYGESSDFVVITRRNENAYYTFNNGITGKIDYEGLLQCGEGAVKIEQSKVLRIQAILTTDTEFDSDGALLAGQLLEPADAGPNTPLVALAHGSEESGWIEAVSYPYQLVARGVSVFVYDKRGTGRSQGQYSQNFVQLADDLAAASQEAKRIAQGRFARFGLFGFSQGGWVAPLAAEKSGAEFIGIGYGLVVDILEEDASQVELELREAGYGDDVITKAKEITDVTARLAVSSYKDGLQELDTLRDKYRPEQWYPLVKGGFTGVLLGMSTDELRDKGIPMFDRLNIDWSIKPMDVLRDVNVPQLWVLAQNDREAPIAKSLERLQTLRGEGKDITIFVFPNTDHGMWEFEQGSDGQRTYTRVTDSYYELLADWAKDAVQPPYSMSEAQ
ncbi:alpha/beta hydrolase family protein [Ningiella sp. W23]|uniref:alpha/beta hydrolase family protein n=1 Tax=Ningiella sp. W23 TaxID=3023715 RepID=UPI003757F866